MYDLGDIVSCKGNFYITLMYKGKYYCVNTNRVADVSKTSTYWLGYDTLKELKKAVENQEDTGAMVVLNQEHGIEPAKAGDIYSRMMLFRKKKGRLVWVPLDELKNNDLNDMLHRKGYYYKNGEENGMFKYKIVEAD